MPTASIKAEKVKQPCLEANEPLRQGITIVEHKIRNLEKRKTKLDGYKDLEAAGKELNSDQLNAIKKYDEVIQTLEFARDLCKQLNALAAESAKAYKKQLRKEVAEKAQQDITRTKEILIIQDVLSNMGQDQVREDLIEGRGKITLTQEELTQIDSLYLGLSPKQDDVSMPYMNQFQSQAEHLSSLMEGKSKEVFGTTYAALKNKLMEIAVSGYFDPPQVANTIEPTAPVVEPQPAPQEPPAVEEVVEAPVETVPAPIPVPVTETSVMPVMQEVSQLESQLIQQQQAAAHLSAFKSGPIDFIQENEVDEGENESSIPTLTYTNQNYTPSKIPAASAQAPEQQQQNAVAPVDTSGEWQDEPSNQQQQQQQPPQQVEDEDDGWEESAGGNNSNWEGANHWQTQQTHHHHHHQQNSDGFIQAGSGRGSRGGRGRGGGRGGPNRSQQPRPSNRGGYREGGGGGGYNKDGQSYFQNGYRGGGGGGGGDRRGGGGRSNYTGERGGRGGGGGRGSRGANTGGYRGGGGGYRQQHHHQQQQQQ